jgi:O-antigen ligase
MKWIAAVLALLFLPFCWHRPRYGMALLLGLQVFFLGGSLDLGSEKFVYGAFFALLMLAWLPALVRTRHEWIKHPIAKWLVAVFVVTLISRFAGAAHGIATVDWFRDLSPLLNYSWIFLGIYTFGPDVDLRKYSLFLLTLVTIVTIPITVEWMSFRSYFDEPVQIIGNATLGPVINLFGASLATAFALDAKDKWGKRKYLALAAGFVVAGFLTGTRTILISVAVAGFAYFLLFRREKRASFRRAIVVVAVPLALISLVVFVLSSTQVVDFEAITARYSEAVTSDMLEDDTIQDRVAETLDAWTAFTERPVFGQGLGYRTETVYHMGGVEFQPEMFFMHNFYAYVLTKFGITGFVVFVGFLISIIRSGAKTYFQRLTGFEKYYCGSMLTLMVALMLTSITGAAFNDRLSTGLLGIMVGMMIAIERRSQGPAGAVRMIAHAS